MEMILQWIAMSAAEQERLPKPSDFMSPSPALKEAWAAWTMLKEERKEAIGRGTSLLKADDWWHTGTSGAKEDEGVDVENREGMEGDTGGEDVEMSLGEEWDEEEEEEEEEEDGGVKLE